MRHARGTTAAGIGLGFKLSVAARLQGFGHRPVGEVRPEAFIDAALGRQRTALVHSNSTRTESYVPIRPGPEAQARSTRRKSRIVTDTNISSVRAGGCRRV